MKKAVALLLALALFLSVSGAGAEASELYHSDFSSGTDGWYPRSMGAAQLAVADGALGITGRAGDWHSPGRDFELTAGEAYEISVSVCQTDRPEATFIVSVAHTRGGTESYENLVRATVKQGEWTTLKGTYLCGDYDRNVLYVETYGAGTLDFRIRDFTLSGEKPALTEERIPSLKELSAGRFDFGTSVTYMEALNASRMAFYGSQFNIMTPGNELKPDSVLDVRASQALAAQDETAAAVHFSAAAPLLNWCRDNGVKAHGHVLVWHSQTPEAFFHQGYDTSKPLVSRDVMLGRLENYIRAVMEGIEETWPGVIVSWDVANEAVDDSTGKLRNSRWLTVIGEDYLCRAFEYARKWAPEGILLFYNDYNTAFEPKQTGIMRVLEELMAEGNIDGYGFQMHHDVAFPSESAIRASLKRVALTGLKMRVSELDVTIPNAGEENLQKQADKYAAVMRMLLDYPGQLISVQTWGVNDNLSWRASQYPLLFDARSQPKPAFWSVAEVLGEGE